MARFVILRHAMPLESARPSHWDLMLEVEDRLWTWALPLPPSAAATNIEGERLVDHRLAYLEYEGPVSGGRGSVERWDVGRYRIISAREGELVVELEGTRCRGRLSLVQMTGNAQRWTLSFEASGATATGLKSGSQVGEPGETPRDV